jgi:glycosyltransferase involved in cell wall biosynthesis
MSEPRHDKFPISVIILTHNEADNIGPCFEHLRWADDVVLVDSNSDDATVDRARATRADIRVFRNRFEDFGQQRNWALDSTAPRHDWILFVDADERFTETCSRAIREAVMQPGQNVGFYLCYRNIFLGRWIRHCKMFPTWQLRLLKRGQVRYRKEGHGQREVMDGPAGYIHQPYDHLDLSKGLSQWIARHNQYSSNEVELIARLRSEPIGWRDLLGAPIQRRRCMKKIAARLNGNPWAWFVYLYVIRGGFLDGRAGLHYCLLRLAHQIHIRAKLYEASLKKRACPPATTEGVEPAKPSRAVPAESH